jgi:hypothetical protein
MRSLTAIVLGTIAGLVVGALSILIAYAGVSLSSASALPTAMVISAIAGGIVAGAAGVMVGCLLTSRERTLVAPLMSLAVASLIVLPGNYANGSLVPPVIYGMALINGLIVARVIGPLCTPGSRSSSQLS